MLTLTNIWRKNKNKSKPENISEESSISTGITSVIINGSKEGIIIENSDIKPTGLVHILFLYI